MWSSLSAGEARWIWPRESPSLRAMADVSTTMKVQTEYSGLFPLWFSCPPQQEAGRTYPSFPSSPTLNAGLRCPSSAVLSFPIFRSTIFSLILQYKARKSHHRRRNRCPLPCDRILRLKDFLPFYGIAVSQGNRTDQEESQECFRNPMPGEPRTTEHRKHFRRDGLQQCRARGRTCPGPFPGRDVRYVARHGSPRPAASRHAV